MEATFLPGMKSRAHRHPGPEAWNVATWAVRPAAKPMLVSAFPPGVPFRPAQSDLQRGTVDGNQTAVHREGHRYGRTQWSFRSRGWFGERRFVGSQGNGWAGQARHDDSR